MNTGVVPTSSLRTLELASADPIWKSPLIGSVSARAAVPLAAVFQDTSIIGEGSKISAAKASESQNGPWLSGASVCPELLAHNVIHTGIADVCQPFQFHRTLLTGAAFLASVAGEGRILIDGRWQVCGVGTGCLFPPGSLAGIEAVANSRWQFAWVRYGLTFERQVCGGLDAPVIAPFDSELFHQAVSGLECACRRAPLSRPLGKWVDVIDAYVQQFALPWQQDDRLSKLWVHVERTLDAAWTGDALARQANMCFEHLRRLCQRQLGRSPMHQVLVLRMRRAAELLVTSDSKLEQIATCVGYTNAFAFSVAFKKRFGCSPSEFRRNRMRAAA